jgi:hypothetical protein
MLSTRSSREAIGRQGESAARKVAADLKEAAHSPLAWAKRSERPRVQRGWRKSSDRLPEYVDRQGVVVPLVLDRPMLLPGENLRRLNKHVPLLAE